MDHSSVRGSAGVEAGKISLLTVDSQILPGGIHFWACWPTVNGFLHKGPIESDQLVGEVNLIQQRR